ncbi:hypothetical protein [Halobacteriovorax sp.]|uniref:hypothetical protein n=1 Tax=Halobacteriovorax sp. TaxID=2020862 RepID=UPI003567D3DC
MTKKLIILTTVYLLSAAVHAASFYSFNYSIKEQDTFKKILTRFSKPGTVISSKSKGVQRTLKMNPKVKNWNKLEAGNKIKIYFEKTVFNMKEYKAYKKTLKANKTEKVKEKVNVAKKADKKTQSKIKGSVHYMTSLGVLSQTSVQNNLSSEYSQYSPYSLGLSGSYRPSKKSYFFSSDLYISAINNGASNTGGDIEGVSDYGIATYMHKDVKKYSFTYFGGLEYESFHSFSTNHYAASNEVVFDKTLALYATLGVSKDFKISNVPLFTKLTFSKSIATSTTPTMASSGTLESYSGFKTNLYLSYNINEKWYIHTMLNLLKMSGSDELSISKYGVGFGYNFY